MGIARKNWLLPTVGFGFAGFIALEAGGIETAFAQANLPPVTIEAPQQRQATGRSTPRRTASRPRASARRVATPSPQQPPVQPSLPAGAGVQRGMGPVPGYVANESVTGTKTTTPIIEIPQSLSVIWCGADPRPEARFKIR